MNPGIVAVQRIVPAVAPSALYLAVAHSTSPIIDAQDGPVELPQ